MRPPVIVFLPGGQQAGRESTSVPKVAEEPWFPEILGDVLRHVERDTVSVTNGLDSRDAAPRRIEPLSPEVRSLEVRWHSTYEPVPMRGRPGLVGLHLEPSESAGSSWSHRVIPPSDELPLCAAYAEVRESAADVFGIPMRKRCEDLPPPGVRHPPTEVTRPAAQRTDGVSSYRFGHALRPFRSVGAASLVRMAERFARSVRPCVAAPYWCSDPVTKATRTVPCQRFWRLHISRPLGSMAHSAGSNPQTARAGLSEPRPTDSDFQGLWPLPYARTHDGARPSSREAGGRRTRAPAFGGGDRVTPAATLRYEGRDPVIRVL